MDLELIHHLSGFMSSLLLLVMDMTFMEKRCLISVNLFLVE